MKVTTLSGIVENGQIRLIDNVRLPEKATVYVVIPGVEVPAVVSIHSPRLVHPEQAADFKKEVVEEIPASDMVSFDDWKKKFDAWMDEVEARAHRYPPGFVMNDSRESMYEGCGE
jgi:hypothetical protein